MVSGGVHLLRLNARELPGRGGTKLLDGGLNRSRPLAYLLGCQTAQWMLDYRERQIRYAQGFGFGSPQGNELGGTDGNRRYPAFFQLDRIVDTPRRARTSIPYGVKNDVALRQVGHDFVRGGRTDTLVPIDHL